MRAVYTWMKGSCLLEHYIATTVSQLHLPGPEYTPDQSSSLHFLSRRISSQYISSSSPPPSLLLCGASSQHSMLLTSTVHNRYYYNYSINTFYYECISIHITCPRGQAWEETYHIATEPVQLIVCTAHVRTYIAYECVCQCRTVWLHANGSFELYTSALTLCVHLFITSRISQVVLSTHLHSVCTMSYCH